MIARGFRSVVWVAAIGVAALACYMLSLRVAAERSELAQLDHRIVAAHQRIRSLQTELGTRGRLQQLEQWNADVLALSAPAANQFVDNEVMLARFDTRTPQVGDAMPVRMASAEAPVRQIPPEAPVRLASADVSAVPAESLVHRATLTTIDAARPAPIRAVAQPANPATTTRASFSDVRAASATPIRTAAATPPRALPPRPAARRGPTALLDDTTLGAIRREARAERRGGARD